MEKKVPIALECGQRRTFAIACDWPGWARSGKDEASAIGSLLDIGPRYAAILRATNSTFEPPSSADAFEVIERLRGNSTTDFGAPAMQIPGDRNPVGPADQLQIQAWLHASWHAFDQALSASEGIELRKGPRGGGRDQEKILAHVIMADENYLAKLGWKFKRVKDEAPANTLLRIREAISEGFEASVRGNIPEKGPGGNLRWPPRFFVRRVLWHILDHAWEIEDRMN